MADRCEDALSTTNRVKLPRNPHRVSQLFLSRKQAQIKTLQTELAQVQEEHEETRQQMCSMLARVITFFLCAMVGLARAADCPNGRGVFE